MVVFNILYGFFGKCKGLFPSFFILTTHIKINQASTFEMKSIFASLSFSVMGLVMNYYLPYRAQQQKEQQGM